MGVTAVISFDLYFSYFCCNDWPFTVVVTVYAHVVLCCLMYYPYWKWHICCRTTNCFNILANFNTYFECHNTYLCLLMHHGIFFWRNCDAPITSLIVCLFVFFVYLGTFTNHRYQPGEISDELHRLFDGWILWWSKGKNFRRSWDINMDWGTIVVTNHS